MLIRNKNFPTEPNLKKILKYQASDAHKYNGQFCTNLATRWRCNFNTLPQAIVAVADDLLKFCSVVCDYSKKNGGGEMERSELLA